MKLLFIIANLGMGGAERVVTLLANGFARRGCEVTLLAYAWDGTPPAFRVAPEVKLCLRPAGQVKREDGSLGRHFKACVDNWHYIRIIRRVIQDTAPLAVVSFMDYTNLRCLIATSGTAVPVIVSERTDPHCWAINPWADRIRGCLYAKAAALVAQSSRALGYFGKRIHSHGVVIPNPVCLPEKELGQVWQTPPARPRIVAAGRLVAEKGFDLLLRAFAQVAGGFPEWSLTILGEGGERQNLERLIAGLGLKGCATLPGKTSRVFAELAEADLFVLSSRFEGFPNVLIEAMAMGVPCVAFDCPSGPREIICDGADGVLVPPGDVNALARALADLMGDAAKRRRLGEAAQAIRHRLSLDTILDQWAAVFDEVRRNGRFESGAANLWPATTLPSAATPAGEEPSRPAEVI